MNFQGLGRDIQLLEWSNFQTARGTTEVSNSAGLEVAPYCCLGNGRVLVKVAIIGIHYTVIFLLPPFPFPFRMTSITTMDN